MQRLLVTGPRQAVFAEAPRPECPADGVVVRAVKTAISVGTEIRVFRAIPVDAAGRFLHETIPFVLPTENGYSMVGEIVEVGPSAAPRTIGERVFLAAPHKQFAAAPAASVVPLPEGVSDEQAVLLNILEVGHIALRRAQPQPGENLTVVGTGVIGLSAVAYGRAFGFRTVAIDPSPERREAALRLGADLAVAPDDRDGLDRAREFHEGLGADVVIEAASVWPAIETSLLVAAPEARIVVAARHTDQPAFNPVGHPHLGKRLTLLTSYGHEPLGRRWDRRRSIALTLDLLARHRLDTAPLITHRLPWTDLPDAYARLDEGEPGMIGVVLDWRLHDAPPLPPSCS